MDFEDWREMLLAAAIGAGALAAAAALYGRYRVLPRFLTGPATCRLEQGGCEALFRTPRAALLGVPNALLGLLLYAALAAGLFLGWPDALLLAGATPALLMSARLGTSLLRNGLECRICWTGHWANLAIWLCLLARWTGI